MERDADGFLLNTSDWSPEIMEEMAKLMALKLQIRLKHI
tara:strand:- start:341 stop:457 length:117 start_codon:yes stop_codon:yes gene_type:complete